MGIINNLRIKLVNRSVVDFLPPMVDHERSYWYLDRYESMSNADDPNPNTHAVPTLCLWCGSMAPAYPLQSGDCGGTTCHECGRTIDASYSDWVYRAEFSDGCYYTLYKSGGGSSGGPRHAPHSSFVSDDPILEMVNPLLPRDDVDDLLSLFRECYASGEFRHDAANVLWVIVDAMPAREYPHKRIVWVDAEKNEPFSANIIDAPMSQYVSECKSRRIYTEMKEFRQYKSFSDAWNNSPDANWMANLLEDVYRKDVFGSRKILAAMVDCCEFVLEDAKTPLLKALVQGGIMPTLRGYLARRTEKLENGMDCYYYDYTPILGDQVEVEDEIRLLAFSRTMYYCHDGLGNLNEGTSEQRLVDAIRYAIEESLSDSPNFGLVIASVCNNFYGAIFPNKERLKKCADVIRNHFPDEFMARMMTEYRLRGENG